MFTRYLMPPVHRRPSAQRHSAGFTLLELLLGMAVFAIGSLAIAGLQTHSVNVNAAAKRQLEVEAHVGRIVEFYKNIPWTEINSPVGVVPAVIDNVDVDLDGVADVLPLLDVDNDAMGGINDVGVNADYLFNAVSGGVFTPIRAGDNCQVFVNLARDVSVPNTLTINVIARWNQRGTNRTYNVLFVKGRDV